MLVNELRPFARAVFRVFEAAFPFKHRPAIKIVTGEFRENGAEVGLPVARGTETSGAAGPRLIAAVGSGFTVRAKLGVFNVEGFDALMVGIAVGALLDPLQHQMAGVIQDVAP